MTLPNTDSSIEESQTDFSSLPLKDLLCHKQWKARVYGYTELAKFLSNNYNDCLKEYADSIRSIPLDSNAAALDAGLTPLLMWVKLSNSDPFFR